MHLRGRRGRSDRVVAHPGRPAGVDGGPDEDLEWDLPFAKWFVGGQAQRLGTTASTATSTPAAATRSRSTGSASPRATRRTITYARAARRWCARRANALTELGVADGRPGGHLHADDPRAPWSRCSPAPGIGAAHSVVFGGFSAEALASRILDADARVVDHRRRRLPARRARPRSSRPSTRRSTRVPERRAGARRAADRPGRRAGPTGGTSGGTTSSTASRRPARRRAVRRRAPALHHVHERHDGQAQGDPAHDRRLPHPCRRPPTGSSSTSSPRPTSSGRAADIGWVTGHSYIVYGPLVQRRDPGDVRGDARLPADEDRWWRIVEELQGDHPLHRAHDDPHPHEVGRGAPRPATTSRACACSASVGEPINPEAWMWYREHIGGDRCPVVDTWWQTETGGIMITPAARDHRRPSPGRPCAPSRGSAPTSSTTTARSVGNGEGGYLVLTAPWPGMLRGIWGDPSATEETYWSRFRRPVLRRRRRQARRRRRLWLLGRVDDVMNISGHRISTAEVEHALVGHPAVAEAAVVGASGRDHRSGHRRLRDPEGRRGGVEATGDARRRAARPRGQGRSARSPSPARSSSPPTPEDPLRQDHAPAAARRRGEPRARRLTTLVDPTVVDMIAGPMESRGDSED